MNKKKQNKLRRFFYSSKKPVFFKWENLKALNFLIELAESLLCKNTGSKKRHRR